MLGCLCLCTVVVLAIAGALVEFDCLVGDEWFVLAVISAVPLFLGGAIVSSYGDWRQLRAAKRTRAGNTPPLLNEPPPLPAPPPQITWPGS